MKSPFFNFLKNRFLFSILLFFLTFFYLFTKPKYILAQYYFHDEFNSQDLNSSVWQIYTGDGNYTVNNGKLLIECPNGQHFPYIYTKNDVFPEGDYEYEIKYRFPSASTAGSGIVLQAYMLPYPEPPREEINKHLDKLAIFVLWQDLSNLQNRIQRRNCLSCSDPYTTLKQTSAPDTKTYVLKIVKIGNNQKVFLDNDINPIYDGPVYPIKPKYIRFGNNHPIFPSKAWTSIEIDYIRIISLNPSPLTPILLIPGHGGSWNLSALTTGITIGPWKKTPFIKVYDNFKNTFLNNGYEENKNYFEFYYDWRKKINKENSEEDLAGDLKNYIDNTVLKDKPPGTKIDMVGHSMGGLLARAYVQEYGKDKVDKVVTVGSPHEGAVKAYNAWEGGEVDDKFNWGSVAFQILLQIHKKNFQTNMDVVRNIAPSTKDLMPIFNFLKNEQNQEINAQTMVQKNDWLNNLKNSLSADVKSIMATIYGIENNPDEDTVEWLKVKPPDWLDNILGKWQDGKPFDKEFTSQGDLTVLKKSAAIPEASLSPEVDGSHIDIIESSTGIQTILNSLNLNSISPIATISSLIRNPSLVFFLHCPAQIKVIAPNNEEIGYQSSSSLSGAVYSPEDKLIVIPNAQTGEYKIIITADGDGEYHLEIGQLTKNKDQWQTISDNISTGDVKELNILFNPNNLKENPLKDETGKLFLTLAKQKLEKLYQYSNQHISSFSTRRRIQYSIKRSIRYLDRALKYLNQGNFYRASRYCLSSLVNLFRTRRSINKYSQRSLINADVQIYSNNELKAVIGLLGEGWLRIYKNSGKIITSSRASRYQSIIKRILSLTEQRIKAASAGENKNLGSIYNLASQKQQKAKEYFEQGKFSESYLNSLFSRLFCLEAYYFLR